jgi:hypothetical protein
VVEEEVVVVKSEKEEREGWGEGQEVGMRGYRQF